MLSHGSERRRKAPERKTKNLGAWVTEGVRDRAIAKAEWLANQRRVAAAREGNELPKRTAKASLSAYITGLILADTPREEALAARLPALLGHRCVAALEACMNRIRSGEDCSLILSELKDIRWDIVGVLEQLRAPYDAALDLGNDPIWDGKH